MKRRSKKRSFRSRRARQIKRLVAFAITTVLAVATLVLGAWHLGLFGQPVSADSVSPTPAATLGATASPTAAPTVAPTAIPTRAPTAEPTAEPSPEPTGEPTAEPTPEPTDKPSPEPTAEPSPEPSVVPANPTAARLITIEETERGVLTGVRIGIDPGHQLKGNSAQEPVAPGSAETKFKVSGGTQGVATGVPEYECVLQVGLMLRDALEAQGAEVFMTREVNEVDISNIERATMMNELGANVVLRLHCNGANNPSLRGIGLYVKSKGDGAQESYAVSEYLIDAMGRATGARTEPIHVSDTYSGLNWSTVPSILVEMGYMSNPEEDRLLCSADYQARLVDGMVKGLEAYFIDHPVPAPTQAPAATATPAPTDAQPVGE